MLRNCWLRWRNAKILIESIVACAIGVVGGVNVRGAAAQPQQQLSVAEPGSTDIMRAAEQIPATGEILPGSEALDRLDGVMK